MEKQGIVTILRSDCERTKATSLRRTLSADMSSKKWLAQNGFSQTMKKIASSEQLLVSSADSSSSSGEEDVEERKDQLEGKQQKEELEKPGQFDIWSSIVSQKDSQDTPKVLPPPYTHPLAKKSASSLSGKSLEICTESLGSESAADGFASDPSSETEDGEEEKEEEEQQQQQQQDLKVFSQALDHREDLRVAKYHYASTDQKSKPKSFPPPLPSLSRKDGASLLMKTSRDNGRLVLEAVTVPSQNQFRAERQDGRLVLTFLNSPSSEDAKNEKSVEGDQLQEEEEEEEVNQEVFEDKFEDFEEVYDDDGGHVDNEPEGEEVESFDDENVPKGMEIVIEKEPKFSSRAINVHRLALTVNKPIRIADMMNPSVTKSLPPRPLVAQLMPLSPHDAASSTAAAAAAASFNTYEYYWRAKPTANPIPQQLPTAHQKNGNKPIISTSPMPNEQRQLFVLRGNKGDYSVHLVKGCKEPRRSLLLWEPNCIATS